MAKKVSKSYHRNINSKQIRGQRKWFSRSKTLAGLLFIAIAGVVAVRTFASNTVLSLNLASVSGSSTTSSTNTTVIEIPAGWKKTTKLLEIKDQGTFWYNGTLLNPGIYEACFAVTSMTNDAAGTITVMDTSIGTPRDFTQSNAPVNTTKDICSTFKVDSATMPYSFNIRANAGTFRVGVLTVKTASILVSNDYIVNAFQTGEGWWFSGKGRVVTDTVDGAQVQVGEIDDGDALGYNRGYFSVNGNMVPKAINGQICVDVRPVALPSAMYLRLTRYGSNGQLGNVVDTKFVPTSLNYTRQCIDSAPIAGQTSFSVSGGPDGNYANKIWRIKSATVGLKTTDIVSAYKSKVNYPEVTFGYGVSLVSDTSAGISQDVLKAEANNFVNYEHNAISNGNYQACFNTRVENFNPDAVRPNAFITVYAVDSNGLTSNIKTESFSTTVAENTFVKRCVDYSVGPNNPKTRISFLPSPSTSSPYLVQSLTITAK